MLESARPTPELANTLGFMLKWCGDRSSAGAFSFFKDHDLHPREFGVLTVLDGSSGVTQQDLADLAGIDTSTMVLVVDELERKGLAERRVDPEDRRRRSVHITRKGATKLAKLRPLVREDNKERFNVLSASEREELLRLLRKVAGIEQ